MRLSRANNTSQIRLVSAAAASRRRWMLLTVTVFVITLLYPVRTTTSLRSLNSEVLEVDVDMDTVDAVVPVPDPLADVDGRKDR
jgi:hypothetical protein